MSDAPTLTIITGLPGSGKTTLALRLAPSRRAVRLCPDEWMESLGVSLWDEDFRARLEKLQRTQIPQLLRSGASVIVEWGTWARAEREALRHLAEEVGARTELIVLDPPLEVLWERVRTRAAEDPPMTRDDLAAAYALFQRPEAAELASYDVTGHDHATDPEKITVGNPPGIRLGAAPIIRVANKALIVRDGALLVTVNRGAGQEWLLCPGGGQSHGEDARSGLARECLEEIGCAVTVGDLACERDYIGATHEFAAHDGWFHQRETYFWCTLADGAEPANGPGADDYQLGVRWIPLDELADHPIAPRHLAGWFAAPESERPRYLGDVN